MPVFIKRAYEPASDRDGRRVLVDRVWPRGRTKLELLINSWERELAPSSSLRTWFGHDPSRWQEFVARYRSELEDPKARQLLDDLTAEARTGRLTLVFGARDTEHNQAVVLRDIIEERLREREG